MSFNNWYMEKVYPVSVGFATSIISLCTAIDFYALFSDNLVLAKTASAFIGYSALYVVTSNSINTLISKKEKK